MHGSTTRFGASTAAGGCFSSPPTLAVSASGWRHVSERCDNLHLPVNSNAPNKNPCHRLGGETDFPRVISNQVILQQQLTALATLMQPCQGTSRPAWRGPSRSRCPAACASACEEPACGAVRRPHYSLGCRRGRGASATSTASPQLGPRDPRRPPPAPAAAVAPLLLQPPRPPASGVGRR